MTKIGRSFGLDVPRHFGGCTQLLPGMPLLGEDWFLSGKFITRFTDLDGDETLFWVPNKPIIAPQQEENQQNQLLR